MRLLVSVDGLPVAASEYLPRERATRWPRWRPGWPAWLPAPRSCWRAVQVVEMRNEFVLLMCIGDGLHLATLAHVIVRHWSGRPHHVGGGEGCWRRVDRASR